MNNKIFIVEDEPTIVNVLSEYLGEWGYSCQSVEDFRQVDSELFYHDSDLVLLDISLPYHNGFYWCQEIRKTSEVPIIFISSASDKMNLVMAMNMGADDFIAKPFDLTVLVAKIQALLRRSYQFGIKITNIPYGPISFSPNLNELRRNEQIVNLTPNETKILLLLFQSVGRVVSREQIMEKLWESDEFIDKNTLSVNMNRLRKKVAEIGLADQIQTVKNKGYLLEEINEI